MFNVLDSYDDFWEKYEIEDGVVWIKGWFYSHSLEKILEDLSSIDVMTVCQFITSLDGHFAIICKKEKFSFLAVDKVRTTPLYISQIDNSIYASYNPHNLVSLDNFDKSIDHLAKLELEMSGFTIGSKTLYKHVYALKPGECVIWEAGNIQYVQYYKYFGKVLEHKDYDTYLKELFDITLGVFRKLVKSVGNRQIVIPLSAGNDSRLVASALKHLGVKNVLCYSYGTKNNFEAKIAKIIAEKLGYRWMFVPLSHRSEKRFYQSQEYKNYLDYAQTYSSVPYIQSLSTIKYLRELGLVDDDAVFINGNSGDFISGSHISKLIKNNYGTLDKSQRKNNILNALIDKHFSLWGYLKTPDNIRQVKASLWNEITKACGELEADDIGNDHLFYEYSEFIDRQSSYVITGQRAYEFYGYEWRMPLWDDDYLAFFVSVPSEYKVNQKLYKDMLKKYNIGNVWGDDIPVNKKSITPKWVIPLRFIAKIPFLFFGKTKWKIFDRCLFYYWMDVTHMMDTTSYFRIIKDLKKTPRNHVSWHAEDYIERINNENIVGK